MCTLYRSYDLVCEIFLADFSGVRRRREKLVVEQVEQVDANVASGREARASTSIRARCATSPAAPPPRVASPPTTRALTASARVSFVCAQAASRFAATDRVVCAVDIYSDCGGSCVRLRLRLSVCPCVCLRPRRDCRHICPVCVGSRAAAQGRTLLTTAAHSARGTRGTLPQ